MASCAIVAFILTLLATSRPFVASMPAITPGVIPDAQTTSLSVNPYIMINLSYLFGWQIAGAAVSQAQTSAACAEISSVGHGKWAAIGLDPSAIKVPLCDSSTTSSNATDSVVFIIHYSTQIFLTQLLSAFNESASFAYLCGNIQYNLLDQFWLNDTPLLGPLCYAGGRQIPPPAETGPGPGATPDAAISVRQTASMLYAYMLATSATSSVELKALCAQASTYVNNLNEELMNGTAIETTLCGLPEPLSVLEALDIIIVLMTKNFITMLESVNNNKGWLEWLCDHVDVDGLNSVGLFGEAVVQMLCQASLADTLV